MLVVMMYIHHDSDVTVDQDNASGDDVHTP